MTSTSIPRAHPVVIAVDPDPHPSRLLWLVKWLLAIPHYIILAFLWIAVFVVSVIAFFGILFTGNYPRALFDFTVGVLRWSWRVAYYSYSGLGTDRYPPFTLEEVADYPAHLDIAYPEHLSRGLVLVKWWLLAIPQYAIVSVILGSSGEYVTLSTGEQRWVSGWPGLLYMLVLFAGVIVAFTGHYPRPLHDLVVGLNRWTFRVGAYALLLTDVYPPLRLDQGVGEPSAWQAPPPPPPSPPPPQAPPSQPPMG